MEWMAWVLNGYLAGLLLLSLPLAWYLGAWGWIRRKAKGRHKGAPVDR
jgi:hypothetical protein